MKSSFYSSTFPSSVDRQKPQSTKRIKKHQNSYAREVVLQSIYQMEVGKVLLEEVLQFKWLKSTPRPEILSYTHTLIHSMQQDEDGDIAYIEKYSHKDISQISVIVLIILRIGFAELRSSLVPAHIAIDDLLELTREYDGEESVSFMNGILDTFYQKEILKTQEQIL